MDYGYQILRHVVQQVFGNLGPAARITIIPIALAYIVSGLILYALLGGTVMTLFEQSATGFGNPQADPFSNGADAAAFGGRMLLGFLLCIPVFLIFYSWAAVGWHRYVLLEEHPAGFAARWDSAMIRGYVGALFRLTLMMILLGIAASLVVGVLFVSFQSESLMVFLTIGLSIGFTWVLTRMGLVLPSAALGTYMKLGESWSTTAPVSGSIILPIMIIPLAFYVVGQLLGVLGFVGGLLTLVVLWLQVLVNLALMTTLYGNLIEGRQLN